MIQKWRPHLHSFDPPLHVLRAHSQPSTSRIPFAKRFFHPPRLSFTSSNHPSPIHSRTRLFYDPKAVSKSLEDRHNFACFRCGGRGHFARSCLNQARCFRCGILGHIKSACPRSTEVLVVQKEVESNLHGIEDFTWVLRDSEMDTYSQMDPMLLDPSVVECLHPTNLDLELTANSCWIHLGSEEPALKAADSGADPTIPNKVLTEGSMEDAEEDMMDGSLVEQKEADLVPCFKVLSQIHSQISMLGRSYTFGAVPGMGLGFGNPVVARLGQSTKLRRPYSRGLALDLATKPWNRLSMLGMESAFGSVKSKREEEILADPPTSIEFGPSTTDFVSRAVSTFNDFPTIEEDLSSDEDSVSSNSLAQSQVELNLDLIPHEDFLDIEIIDDLDDFCSAFHRDVHSPIKQPQTLPKNSKRAINLEPQAAVRRSPRLSKVAV